MSGSMPLRRQLLWLVGGPLLFLMMIETLVSYRIGTQAANFVFDRWLLDSANFLARELQYLEGSTGFSVNPAAIEVFELDEFDEMYFSVELPAGELIAGTSLIEMTASSENIRNGPVFRDIEVRDEPARAVSLFASPQAGNEVILTVAETLNKRQAMTSDLLHEEMISKAMLFVAVLLIIGAAFDRGLRPLILLSREMAQRSPLDLTPIDVGRAPQEVRGLLENTNQLLARLDSALSQREQFIGNISHQIRTPLAGMKLQAQLAQQETVPFQVFESLGRISLAADQMSRVNSQLMMLARAETAIGRGVRKEKVSLSGIVRDSCNELAKQAMGRAISLHMDLPTLSVQVSGESTLLTELVYNLVENAIIYGNEGGNVWVSLANNNRSICLQVEDDGPGIPEQNRPRIFERFYRPVQLKGQGCGLGLSIVQEIVLAHGASIELRNGRGKSGVCFQVIFPAMTDSEN